MGYLIVFVIAAAVGVAVYAVTLRGDAGSIPSAARASGAPGAPPPAPPAGGGDYVPVTGWRPDWQSRLTGLLGLLLAVVLGAAGIAALLYVGGSMLARLVAGAAG